MIYASPEHILLRYLVKFHSFGDRPEWKANPHVQRCLSNGSLDLSKVRDLFAERGIMTAGEFDISLNDLVVQNFIASDLSVKQSAIEKFNVLETARKNQLEALEEQGIRLDKSIPDEIKNQLNNLEA